MSLNRQLLVAVLFSVVGCGGGAPPKEYPKQTEEQKAELQKQHAELKAKAEGGAAAPGASK